MRRILAIAAALIAAGLLIALPGATGAGSGGTYEVRAVFDNGAFLVPDEEVRVAGAAVGTVKSVDVSGDDEIVSLEGGGHPEPGKAVAVLNIEDSGFKDFREDATCLIRPQSLIGERFVDCTPTQPRSPGEQPPPELEQIPDGEPGAGQRLLPLENNGTTVDLDLIQNIQRVPYRDRFRLILNDLGASLAARGDDLGEVIDRANPALRQTDRVLNILALQNRQLASLASNGDEVLEPLARNRTSVTGFLRNAAIAGGATAERGADLEEGLQKFPATLRQVRLTMTKLKEFADQGTPLFADLKVSGANISKATQELAPFARAGVPALTSLGSAAQSAGPKLAAADPLLTELAGTASAAVPVGNNLSSLFDTFVRTKGFESLGDFIYNTNGAINGFDSFGHFLRTNVQVTNCIDVSAIVIQGCEAFFQELSSQGQKKKKKKKKRKARRASAGLSAPPPPPQAVAPQPPLEIPPLDQLIPPLGDDDPPTGGEDPATGDEGSEPGSGSTAEPDAGSANPGSAGAQLLAARRAAGGDQRMSMKEARSFLLYLLGSGT
jgi:phospholipid/cholesterol/gamma-HCH transport system substrate-binding protein